MTFFSPISVGKTAIPAAEDGLPRKKGHEIEHHSELTHREEGTAAGGVRLPCPPP